MTKKQTLPGTLKTKLFENLPVFTPKGDEVLMEMVKKNNQGAFEELFKRYKDQIFSYCFYLLKSKPKAEEVSQETFLKVYRSRESFRKGARFRPWLWAIARNSVLDELRRKDAMNFVNDFQYQDEDFNIEELSLNERDGEYIYIQKAEQEALKFCLDGLKPSQKEVMVLRVFSDLSYEEISHQIRISLSSVKGLINRAKKSLKVCLEGKI